MRGVSLSKGYLGMAGTHKAWAFGRCFSGTFKARFSGCDLWPVQRQSRTLAWHPWKSGICHSGTACLHVCFFVCVCARVWESKFAESAMFWVSILTHAHGMLLLNGIVSSRRKGRSNEVGLWWLSETKGLAGSPPRRGQGAQRTGVGYFKTSHDHRTTVCSSSAMSDSPIIPPSVFHKAYFDLLRRNTGC